MPAVLSTTPMPDFNSTLGAMEIGAMISIFLFGIVNVQTFTYYKNFQDDTWYLKAFVAFIWLLELAHTILVCHTVYYLSVVKYGQENFILEFPVSAIAGVVLQGIIGPAVQIYYAHRIRVLSGRWVIPSICWILSILRFISLLANAGEAAGTRAVETYSKEYRWLILTCIIISTAADILNTASLCYYLWNRRLGTSKKTRRMIDQLISWTIQTGLLTSIGTVIMLILLIMMDNFAWLTVLVITTRFFSNSLLATLNARTALRELNKNTVNLVESLNFRLPSTAPGIHVSVNRVTGSAPTEASDVQEPQKARHPVASI